MKEIAKMGEDNKENNTVSNVKGMDAAIFNHFKNLTNPTEDNRVKAGLQLLQHLSQHYETEKGKMEIKYALKRLIRGAGASTSTSRAGFFTTFIAFLELVPDEDLKIKEILETTGKELNVGGNVTNKEDADAIVGQILICEALIRSKRIEHATADDISSITKLLISCSNHKSYHNSLAFSVIINLLENVKEELFSSAIWPHLRLEVSKAWDKMNINTVQCVITAKNDFPNIITAKYLKTHFGGTELLNKESFKPLGKIFWNNASTNIVTHPCYESFAKYIAKSKNLKLFWKTEVSNILKSPNKLIEISTLKILTDILLNMNAGDSNYVSDLLTENFIKMIVTSLRGMKFNKNETLRAFYDDFFEALEKYTASLEPSQDAEKVKIIQKLILHPGILSIEKYTTHKVIHQLISNLEETGVQKIYETYENIFLGKLQKNPEDEKDTWLNVERQNAGYMLQNLITHKNVQNSYDWRYECLKQMMIAGLFYSNANYELTTKEDPSTIENEFSTQMRNIFYVSLQSKMSQLKKEKDILLQLVEYCQQVLQKKNFNKFFRIRVNERSLKAWNEMFSVFTEKTKEKKLSLIFHILLLHMGLQMFREPEMAEAAILDLEKCLQKANKGVIQKINLKPNDGKEEPEWIEVLIDLFLHLLSQNTSTLRNVVNSVFPYLCEKLTLNSMHQILSVLDMTEGYNPLSETDENEDEDTESENDEDDDTKEKEDDSEDEEDNEDEDEDDEEELMAEEEEDVTLTDKLRNAVSIALGTSGIVEDDQKSIDLDDIDEEEGKRLDEALSQAFSLIKKDKGKNKKSKEYRVKKTTIMHFRIRVLDLMEIYIQHNPSLLFSVEILLSLLNMIEHCTEKEQKPLLAKIERILKKLTGLRQFSNVDNINQKNICDYLRLIIEKKVKAPAFDTLNKLKAKCCVFLISCGKFVSSEEKNKYIKNSSNEVSVEILKVLREYLGDFIRTRNPAMNITLLMDIFKMRWAGIWQLAITLAEEGLQEKTRVFRRIQVLELLDILYKNHEMIRQSEKSAKKNLLIIENCIQKHIETLTAENKQISSREFIKILDVIFSCYRCHNKIPSLRNNLLESEQQLAENIQNIRQKMKLDNLHSYSRFCQTFKVKIIRNSEIQEIVKQEDITSSTNSLETLDEMSLTVEKNTKLNKKTTKENGLQNQLAKNGTSKTPKGVKRKAQNSSKELKREKKLKKEERLRISSQGLNGGISFTDENSE